MTKRTSRYRASKRRTSKRDRSFNRMARKMFSSIGEPAYLVDARGTGGRYRKLATALRAAKTMGKRDVPATIWKMKLAGANKGSYRPYAVVVEGKIAYFKKS